MERELYIKQLDQRIKPLGMGGWAIGGTWGPKDVSLGWSNVDDKESIKALKYAYERGIQLFDTAATYGYGHSEKVLGEALHDVRDKIFIATKFGFPCDDVEKVGKGESVEKESIIAECHDSLRRLHTDYIDIYQLHKQPLELEKAEVVLETLELLRERGDIRSYGWSTDTPKEAEFFLKHPACSVIQFDLNIFANNEKMVQLIDEHQVVGLNRQPLAMGLLSGKYNSGSKLPRDDVRSEKLDWQVYFDEGVPSSRLLSKLEAIREIITSGGRTMTQGALAWNWARSPYMVPIPGFKNGKQVEENISALEFGPLSKEQVDEINNIVKA
jgi:aryl-alcohol dehydrogenase-like predicted oxidoreductase